MQMDIIAGIFFKKNIIGGDGLRNQNPSQWLCCVCAANGRGVQTWWNGTELKQVGPPVRSGPLEFWNPRPKVFLFIRRAGGRPPLPSATRSFPFKIKSIPHFPSPIRSIGRPYSPPIFPSADEFMETSASTSTPRRGGAPADYVSMSPSPSLTPRSSSSHKPTPRHRDRDRAPLFYGNGGSSSSSAAQATQQQESSAPKAAAASSKGPGGVNVQVLLRCR